MVILFVSKIQENKNLGCYAFLPSFEICNLRTVTQNSFILLEAICFYEEHH